MKITNNDIELIQTLLNNYIGSIKFELSEAKRKLKLNRKRSDYEIKMLNKTLKETPKQIEHLEEVLKEIKNKLK